MGDFVAPYAGAWIEIVLGLTFTKKYDVAPYAGAWIEIHIRIDYFLTLDCRPLRGGVD